MEPRAEEPKGSGQAPISPAEFRRLAEEVERLANEVESLGNRTNTLVHLLDLLNKRVDRLEPHD